MKKTIQVDVLARVEGEGAMFVSVEDGKVDEVRLKIFEPPRFFEALLRGRDYSEAPDITARICGICPVAYQMSSVHAMEMALGVEIPPEIRALRRLLYCGEWIESHGLHIYMLHAPDFLGYAGAIEMAKDHRELVQQGLRLKKAGNTIVQVLGGREIHPINVRVGGFYRAPRREELRAMLPELEWARQAAEKTAHWAASLDFPELERDYEYVSVRNDAEGLYPFNLGRVISSQGLDIPASDFLDHFEEQHVAHSNALHCVHKGHGAYFVGPMARYNLAREHLPESSRALADAIGLTGPCHNPFKSILIRAIEVHFACVEAIRLIETYTPPDEPAVAITPRAGVGHAATEAPRGILYHRYALDDEGNILEANIIPPTSQNQKTIEEDLRDFVTPRVHLEDEALKWQCEQAIRNYDPCISCATHFLKLDIRRR